MKGIFVLTCLSLALGLTAHQAGAQQASVEEECQREVDACVTDCLALNQYKIPENRVNRKFCEDYCEPLFGICLDRNQSPGKPGPIPFEEEPEEPGLQ